MTAEEQDKVINTVLVDRETNNQRAQGRSTISSLLDTPRIKHYKGNADKIAEIINSSQESEDISAEDSSDQSPRIPRKTRLDWSRSDLLSPELKKSK